MRDKCDVLIIGAGIVGYTVARELLRRGVDDIVIVEKEEAPGKHASGRNSGVLHAGIYYSPETFKARFTVEGNHLMKEFCREKGLPLLESGKVIVAKNETEVPGIEELERRARANGVKVRLIDANELKEVEPYAFTCQKALYSPNTAVINPKRVLRSLEEELLSSRKVAILYRTLFTGLKGTGTVVTNRGAIAFFKMVNAAGAFSETVAHAFGLGYEYRIIPFKGTYRRLRPERGYLVKGNIYPVPDLRNPFLGVHFTRSVDGEVTIGPTAIPALGRENYGILRGIAAEAIGILCRDATLFIFNPAFRSTAFGEVRKYCKNAFFTEAKKLVPVLEKADILPSNKVGIRPQLVDWRTKKLVMDYVVLKDGDTVHILNAISPGFTSSMSFARYVVNKLLEREG
ncbi:MAG: L-2-hydroxyglutarate oxidase [Bacillota bacterium]